MKKRTKQEVQKIVDEHIAKNPHYRIGHVLDGWYHIGNGILTDYAGLRKFCEELEEDNQHLLKQKD